MAVMGALKRKGITVPQMSRMAGANRSTIYRWVGGEVAPDYSLVNNLAAKLWGKHPDLARELVEASGYAWAEPDEEPEPEPAISPRLLAAIRREVDPEDQQRVIDALERTLRGELQPSGPRAAGESPAGPPSAERRAAS